MTIRFVIPALLALLASLPVSAQQTGMNGTGAILRSMDKISGDVLDFELGAQQTKKIGRIQVTVTECRYPASNPTGEAFAHLVIRNEGIVDPIFQGWMIASSPALNAVDHARYDVWVLRCTTS